MTSPSGENGEDPAGDAADAPNEAESTGSARSAAAASTGDGAAGEVAAAQIETSEGTEFGVRDLGAPTEDVKHPVAGKPYDPDPAREKIRGYLAIAAFGLFAVFALGVAAAVVLGASTWDEVEGMTGALLPAIVSVVGTTTGFYFGTKAKGDG